MKISLKFLLLAYISLISGCTSSNSDNGMRAKYTKQPIIIDGKLDDQAWKNAKIYTLHLSKDKLEKGEALMESGEVQVAWDDHYLYLGIKFQDSNILATGDKDQIHHYRFGDLCELFLKPANEENYVELYVTPHNKKTSFYIPNQKGGGPSQLDDLICGLKVAAYVGDGTLNKRDDHDKWWSGEMAMPVKDLEKLGEKVSSGSKWKILVARYNYLKSVGKDNDEIEYSMTPSLSKTSYHLIDEYAELHLVK